MGMPQRGRFGTRRFITRRWFYVTSSRLGGRITMDRRRLIIPTARLPLPVASMSKSPAIQALLRPRPTSHDFVLNQLRELMSLLHPRGVQACICLITTLLLIRTRALGVRSFFFTLRPRRATGFLVIGSPSPLLIASLQKTSSFRYSGRFSGRSLQCMTMFIWI